MTISLLVKALLGHVEIKKSVLEDPNKRRYRRFDSNVYALVSRVLNEVHSTDRATQKILEDKKEVLEMAKALCLDQGLSEGEITDSADYVILALRTNLSRRNRKMSQIVNQIADDKYANLDSKLKLRLFRLEALIQTTRSRLTNSDVIRRFIDRIEVKNMTRAEYEHIVRQNFNCAQQCMGGVYAVYDHILPFGMIKNILTGFGVGLSKAIITLGAVEYFRTGIDLDDDIKGSMKTLAHFGQERRERLMDAVGNFNVLFTNHQNDNGWTNLLYLLLMETNFELMWDKLLILYIFEYKHFENIFLCGMASFLRGMFVVLFAELGLNEPEELFLAVGDFVGDPYIFPSNLDQAITGNIIRRGLLSMVDNKELQFLITKHQFGFLSEILHSMNVGDSVFFGNTYKPWAKFEVLQLFVNITCPSIGIDLDSAFSDFFPIPAHLKHEYIQRTNQVPRVRENKFRQEIEEWLDQKINKGGNSPNNKKRRLESFLRDLLSRLESLVLLHAEQICWTEEQGSR